MIVGDEFSRHRLAPTGARPKSRVLLAATLFAATLGAAGPAAAQNKTFRFGTGACDYTLRIDTRKVDQGELEATLKFLFDYTVVFGGLPDKASDFPAETRRVEAECAASAKSLAETKLLSDPRIETIRREVAEADAEYCRFTLDKYAGWSDPARLRPWSKDPKCTVFVDALAGTVPLDKAVDALVAASCKDNADPKRCRADFVRESKDPDKHRLNLLSYGWGNCVNATIGQAKLDSDRRVRIGRELIKRYKVKESCEN